MHFFIALLLAALAEGPCSVEGVVLNAATGEPVKAAAVTLVADTASETDAGTSTTTGEDGRYAIRGLAPGRYVLVVKASGFANSYGPQGALTTESVFTLDQTAKSRQIVVRLAPNAAVSGRIEQPDGAPAAGALAFSYRVGHSPTGARLLFMARDTTDEDGRYRLPSLPAGTYYLVATAPGALGKRERPCDDVLPRDGPHRNRRRARDCPRLGTPAYEYPARRHPHRLRAASGGAADGRCAARAGRAPRAGAGLELSRRSSDEPGRYEACGIVPGPHYAVAYNRAGYYSRQPVEIDATGEQEIQLEFAPPADITGRITFEGEAPAKVTAIRAELHAAERTIAETPHAAVGESRSFTLARVNPGRYMAALSGVPDGFYVKSLRAGTENVLGKTMEVAGSSPGPLEFVLSPNVGSVHGTVQDDKGERPAAGAIVLLLPEEPERQSLGMYVTGAVADASGAFTVAHVAPGRYRILALDRIAGTGAVTDPDFAAPLRARGEPLEVREKSAAQATLRLIRAADLPAAP